MIDRSDRSLEDAAWAQFSVDREKATFATTNMLIVLLVPAWSAFDFYLEPAMARRFLALRMADVAVTVLLAWLIARSSDLRKNRITMSASVLAVGLTIAAMLPHVGAHYALYTFGFSLVFWGCGLLLIWPLGYAAASFGVIVGVHVAAYFALDEAIPRGVFIGSLFYVASAAIVSSAQLVMRRRLERGAFNASFALAGRNGELAETLHALRTTQARLVAASALLAESLDAEQIEGRMMSLAVPTFASWATLIGTGPNATTRVAEHVDPEKKRALRDAIATSTVTARGRSEGARAAECIVNATPADLTRVTGANVENVVSARSLIVTELVARGQAIGTLVLGRIDRNYEPNEVAFAEEIAYRTALALDNARLVREAEEAVRVRDEFISIASHELRTPLHPLRMIVAKLLRSPGATERDRAHLVTAERQVERLTALVTQLLDVSQLTGGGLALRREEMDLATLVQDVVTRFEGEAARAESTLTIQIDAPAWGMWDRSRLDQVLSNLLSNALKYGSGKPIRVSLAKELERVVLRVADQGIGIAAADHARIFQRFERAVSSSNYGGFGLGLWIVRLIVDRLGGTVRVVSEVDSGSTFIVELPSSGLERVESAVPACSV